MQERTKQNSWNGCDDQPHRQLRAGRICLAGEGTGQAYQSLTHVLPEEKDNSGKGANMDSDVDHLPLVLQPRQARQQNEVSGGGDRQKLGNSLNQGDEDQLEKGHDDRPLYVPKGSQRSLSV